MLQTGFLFGLKFDVDINHLNPKEMRNLAFLTVVASVFLLGSCSNDDDTDLSSEVILSTVEKNDLLVLREEEKLARDVYLYAYDKYGETIFNSIASSEQKHMDKLLGLLTTYNIADPALATRGDFTNQMLQTLYNDLTAQVDISLLDALKVGATIEDLDIKDIIDFESRTNKTAILNVYEKLRCGSRNHMRSYYGQLLNNSVTYMPQFISSAELTEIITASNEQCGK